MSVANVNSETGIRYGVIQGNHASLLLEEIFQNGTNESFEGHKRDLISDLSHWLKQHGQRDDFADEMAKDCVEELEWDDYQAEEECYSYSDAGAEFLVSWLGGAPLIWVTKSPRIVAVKSLCSPCVPNAGDLDSGIVADATDILDTKLLAGYACYGLPIEWQNAIDNENADVASDCGE